MADKKPTRIKFTTPPGIFQFPKLNEINYGSEKYPVKDGNFETGIIIDKSHPEWASFEERLKPLYEQAQVTADRAFADLKVDARKELEKKGGISLRPLFADMYDEKTEELLPTVKGKFKMRQGGIIKNGPKKGQSWMMRPLVFDARGNPIPMFIDAPGSPNHGKPLPRAPKIWGGTRGRISFEIDTNKDGSIGYFVALDGKYGLSATLRAVQVIQLSSSQAATADSYGFGSEEDGFEYDPAAASEFVSSDTSSDAGEQDTGGISGDF